MKTYCIFIAMALLTGTPNQITYAKASGGVMHCQEKICRPVMTRERRLKFVTVGLNIEQKKNVVLTEVRLRKR